MPRLGRQAAPNKAACRNGAPLVGLTETRLAMAEERTTSAQLHLIVAAVGASTVSSQSV